MRKVTLLLALCVMFVAMGYAATLKENIAQDEHKEQLAELESHIDSEG
jgi:preprotein translocase subunit YajC